MENGMGEQTFLASLRTREAETREATDDVRTSFVVACRRRLLDTWIAHI